MTARIYHDQLVPEGCHVMLDTDHGTIPRAPNLPRKIPPVLSGTGGVLVITRCPDFGNVEIEVWAGEPGTDGGWRTIFDDHLQTYSRGFRAGPGLGPTFHINAPAGEYRVRADVRTDAKNQVWAVRFVFPESPELKGSLINP